MVPFVNQAAHQEVVTPSLGSPAVGIVVGSVFIHMFSRNEQYVQICLQVFDVQRKVTYKNLSNWYKELREYRPEIPCLVVANKIDGE